MAVADERRHGRMVSDICVDEVRAARVALLELAARLRSDDCAAAGVAMTRRLLRDPSSPLYEPAANDDLWRAARAAWHALTPA